MTGANLTIGKTIVTGTNITIAGIFGILGISQVAISCLAILLIIDSLTGLIKAWYQKEATSRNLIKGVLAKGLLLTIPLTIGILGYGAGLDMSFMVASSLSILMFAEAYSIIANIYEIYSGKKLPEYDAVSMVLKGILDTLKNILDTKTK